jgi:hypothetical protein
MVTPKFFLFVAGILTFAALAVVVSAFFGLLATSSGAIWLLAFALFTVGMYAWTKDRQA